MPNEPFKGTRYSENPLTPEENSQIREMMNEVGKAWPSLYPIAQFAGSARTLGVVIATAAIIGGAIRWAIMQGVFS